MIYSIISYQESTLNIFSLFITKWYYQCMLL